MWTKRTATTARTLLGTCPDIPQAKLLLASILGDIGKLGEAIALAKKAAKKIPNKPAVHYILGVQLARFNRMAAGGETAFLGLATMGEALEQLHNVRFAKGLRVTEKNLGHQFFLGVIAMIASGTPIIYCRRDPVPTAWSC